MRSESRWIDCKPASLLLAFFHIQRPVIRPVQLMALHVLTTGAVPKTCRDTASAVASRATSLGVWNGPMRADTRELRFSIMRMRAVYFRAIAGSVNAGAQTSGTVYECTSTTTMSGCNGPGAAPGLARRGLREALLSAVTQPDQLHCDASGDGSMQACAHVQCIPRGTR